MQTSHHTNRFLELDMVKILAIFFVVVLHISEPALYKFGTIPVFWWLSCNFYESLSVVAVPLFVLASGQLLLDKNESYSVFFAKRIKRIVLPWIGWTSIYFLWTVYGKSQPVDSLSHGLNLFSNIFFTYFWFLPMITGIYLLTPLVRVFLKAATKVDVFYLLSLWFIAVIIIFFLQRTYASPASPDVILNGISNLFFLSLPYAGYFILGSWIHKLRIYYIPYRLIIFAYVLMTLITFVGTYVSSQTKGALDLRYLSYFAPNVIFQSITFFALFSLFRVKKHISISPFVQSIMMSLSKATLGIYLSHKLVTEVITQGLFGYRLEVLNFSPVFSVPLIALVISSLSFFLIYILQKIPVVRYFVS